MTWNEYFFSDLFYTIRSRYDIIVRSHNDIVRSYTSTRQGQAVHRQTFDTEFSRGDWSDVKSDSKSVFSAKNPVGLCPVKISFNFRSEDRSSIRKLKRDSTFYRTQSSLFDFLSNNFVGRVAVDENVSRELGVDRLLTFVWECHTIVSERSRTARILTYLLVLLAKIYTDI